MSRTSPVGMMLDFAFHREAPDSKTLAEQARCAATSPIPADMRAALLALAAASQTWWENRRPVGWTLEQHLADPTAGCSDTGEERALAQAVAIWLAQSA